jgi:1-aminocyclopropane-1-carboxylate deaminase
MQFNEAPVQELFCRELQGRGLRLSMLRGDAVHPVVSGNKLWKLKDNLEEAARLGKHRLVTFGGAYSNHLLAVACAGKDEGFSTLGIVRGEEELDSALLQQCRQFGMELVQVSRNEYRDKAEALRRLQLPEEKDYFLPEGGTNALAMRGCAEALPTRVNYDHIFVPVGTGGTLAGFALGASHAMPRAVVEGISVLKGAEFLRGTVEELVPALRNWKLHLDFHRGGYAKTDRELLSWMEKFTAETDVPLEPIYTGKMMRAVFDLAAKHYFRPGASILVVHTGGLRGWSPTTFNRPDASSREHDQNQYPS